MGRGVGRIFMNNMDSFALRMLKFIEDSVNEALRDQSSRKGLLIEADCALRVLQKTLLREDQKKNAQLMMLGVFDWNFERIASENPPDPSAKLQEALENVLKARIVFNQSAK
jgi:hypothetical protein